MIQENGIKAKLETIGVSADVFCTLGNISHSKWSRALRGVENFNGDTLVRLSRLADELVGLANDAAPYVLSFKNAEAVGRLLNWRRAGLRLIPIPVGPQQIVAQFESRENSADSDESLVTQQ
jgi:hypothetical protein